MSELFNTFLAVTVAVIPIVNPLGGALVFLAYTSGADPAARRDVALRVAIYSFIVLNVSLYVGAYVLGFFGISVPVLRVAGGCIVAFSAWKLLQEPRRTEHPRDHVELSDVRALAFYPLTMPLTTGPGTISVLIGLGTGRPQHAGLDETMRFALAALAATAAVAALIYLCYAGAERIARVFGPTGTDVALRLSAFILFCIGVQIFWNGFSELLASLPQASRPQ